MTTDTKKSHGRKQDIRVVSETLNNLMVAVEKGQYRIPQFQREYVWPISKVLVLFDSIFNETPIGSFFLWKADREFNHLFRHSIDPGIGPVQDGDDITFILDGQQRITSLYVTLNGLSVNGNDYRHVCLDVTNGTFTNRKPDNSRYFSVADIWASNKDDEIDKLESPHRMIVRAFFRSLDSYPVPVIEVREKGLAEVCVIFQRINQGGNRLDRFDLIAAMTFTPKFDLRKKFAEDVASRLEDARFCTPANRISPAVVTQLLALLKKGACTEAAEFGLTAVDIDELWRVAVDGVMLAIDTLRKNMGVVSYAFLPYDAQLTMTAYFFAKSGRRAPSDSQLAWLRRWFWRSSFAQHYGSAVATKMGQELALFDQMIAGGAPEFAPAMNISTQSLVDTKMTRTGSAVRNAFLCVLAQREPLHLANNERLDLSGGQISDFASPQKHHIFPQAMLRSLGEDAAAVQALPNFCFLPAELNLAISDSLPSKYIPTIRAKNPNFDKAAESHLLPVEIVVHDDYAEFLCARAELILSEVERLTGLSTAPTPSERQATIRALEVRLRSLIDGRLSHVYGMEYWKIAIPGDIQDEVKKRMASEALKQPGAMAVSSVTPRQKLEFLHVFDYFKVISAKANWPHFEGIFLKLGALQKHIESLVEFRNAVMHSRALSEVTRLQGEAALAWFALALAEPSIGTDSAPDVEE